MNILKQFLMTAVFATLLGSGSLALAESPFPFQTDEFDFPIDNAYISCLNESVDIHYYITIRFREFETPSGIYHYIEHWNWYGEFTGQDSGRIWIEQGSSPGVIKVGPGEVAQWTSRGIAIPVAEGPKFRYNQTFKVTVNANGDLTVLREPPEDIGEWMRCLGPKEK